MTRYTYLLIIWSIAACCAISRGQSPEDQYKDSKYVPLCFSTKAPPKRNAIYALTGPGPSALPGTRGLLGLGYFRQLKDDLEVGGFLLGTDKGVLGWAIGVGARF